MRKHSEFLTKIETARRAVRPDPAPAPPPPVPTPQAARVEQIADTADMIENAMEKLTGGDAPVPAPVAGPTPPPAPVYEDEGEPTKPYLIEDDEDDSVTPRPKFDFDDLKFGSNFNNEE
jgi:hypothetical protein